MARKKTDGSTEDQDVVEPTNPVVADPNPPAPIPKGHVGPGAPGDEPGEIGQPNVHNEYGADQTGETVSKNQPLLPGENEPGAVAPESDEPGEIGIPNVANHGGGDQTGEIPSKVPERKPGENEPGIVTPTVHDEPGEIGVPATTEMYVGDQTSSPE